MDISMKRTAVALTVGLGAAIGAYLALRPPAAIGAERTTNGQLDSCVISGKLTVELVLDPSTGPANAAAWTGPIKDVDEVILLDKWALLRKRNLGTDGTLIVPREQIVFINIGQ
jgi:hypothetical protein